MGHHNINRPYVLCFVNFKCDAITQSPQLFARWIKKNTEQSLLCNRLQNIKLSFAAHILRQASQIPFKPRIISLWSNLHEKYGFFLIGNMSLFLKHIIEAEAREHANYKEHPSQQSMEQPLNLRNSISWITIVFFLVFSPSFSLYTWCDALCFPPIQILIPMWA